MNNSQLLTKQQVAERMAVTTRTLQEWMASGRVAYCKIGRAVRFTEAQFDQLLKTHTIKAVA